MSVQCEILSHSTMCYPNVDKGPDSVDNAVPMWTVRGAGSASGALGVDAVGGERGPDERSGPAVHHPSQPITEPAVVRPPWRPGCQRSRRVRRRTPIHRVHTVMTVMTDP